MDENNVPVQLGQPTSPAETPPETPSPQPESPRKSKKALFIILSIVAVLLIAGGVVAYLYFTRPATVKEPVQSTQPETLTAEAISAHLRPLLQGQLQENSDEFTYYTSPSYQPDGYAFSTYTATASGFHATGTKENAVQNLSVAEAYLAEKGFTKTVLEEGDEEAIYAARYEAEAIVCVIQDGKPFDQNPEGYSVTLGCADKADYTLKAQSLTPFYDVYKESGADVSDVLLSDVTIDDSQSEGYKTASVGIGGATWGSVGGFAGLFYQTPDSIWHYFTGTQSLLSCSDFDTEDLKKAYLGEPCYIDDTNESSTVSL